MSACGKCIVHSLYPILIVALLLLLGLVILYLPRIITEKGKEITETKKPDTYDRGYPVSIVDALGREISMRERPERIISLAPSLTQTVFIIGSEDRLVGRTRFCRWPPEAERIQSVGGPAAPHIESMMALQPDLVLATTLTPIEVVRQIEALSVTIAIFKQEGVDGTFNDMEVIGRLIGSLSEANIALKKLNTRRFELREKVEMVVKRPKTLLLYGVDGLYSARVGTFPSDMIVLAGGDNVVKATASEWPQLSMESIIEWNPEVIMVTLRPGEEEKRLVTMVVAGWKDDARWATISAVRENRILYLDDTLMSVPGPQMIETAVTIAKALHPEIFSESR